MTTRSLVVRRIRSPPNISPLGSICASGVKQRAVAVHGWLREERIPVHVPLVVVAEFWRGRTDGREAILASVDIEAPTVRLAMSAGEALAAVKKATLVDAVVMASAALRGDVVYTSDVDDLTLLQRHFPAVRLLAV